MSKTRVASFADEHQGYWCEKYAVVAVANWFVQRGYEARISVRGPASALGERTMLGGLEVPKITRKDFANPKHQSQIYYDSPGCIDLVARKNHEVWIVQAKGITKGTSAPGDIAQAVGQVILDMTATGPALRYAIVLPDEPRFMRVLRKIASDNQVLGRDDFRFFLVSKQGQVRCLKLSELLKV